MKSLAVCKRAHLLLYFCFSMLNSEIAGAQTERDSLRDIMTSRNSAELSERIASEDELERTKRICSMELEANRVPSTCFVVLQKEKRARLITQSVYMKERHFLETLCQRQSRSLSIEDADAILHQKQHSLTESCRASVEERLNDLRYRAEVDSPQVAFEMRARPVQILKAQHSGQ